MINVVLSPPGSPPYTPTLWQLLLSFSSSSCTMQAAMRGSSRRRTKLWVSKRGSRRRRTVGHKLVVQLRGAKCKVPLMRGTPRICVAQGRPVFGLLSLPPVFAQRPVWQIWIHWRSRRLWIRGPRWWGRTIWRSADLLEDPQLGHVVIIFGSVPVSSQKYFFAVAKS